MGAVDANLLSDMAEWRKCRMQKITRPEKEVRTTDLDHTDQIEDKLKWKTYITTHTGLHFRLESVVRSLKRTSQSLISSSTGTAQTTPSKPNIYTTENTNVWFRLRCLCTDFLGWWMLTENTSNYICVNTILWRTANVSGCENITSLNKSPGNRSVHRQHFLC